MADKYSRTGVARLAIAILFMRICLVAGLTFSVAPGAVEEGSHIVFKCTAPAPSAVHFFDISKIFSETERFPIAHNAEISALYKSYPRWTQNLAIMLEDGKPVLYLTLSGALAEDAGTFACKFGREEKRVDLHVQMPVTEVYITANNVSGSTIRYSDGDTVHYEQPFPAGHISPTSSSTLRLVAVVNGSLYPPTPKIMIGGSDVTAQFVALQPIKTREHKEAGLGVYMLQQQYSWRNGDKSMYSGKTLTFTASVADTPPKSISVTLDVPFAPMVNCGNTSAVAVLNGWALITCEVRANPFGDVRLYWRWGEGNEFSTLLMNVQRGAYSANYTIVDQFTRKVHLLINNVKNEDFRSYQLIAKMYNKLYQATVNLEHDGTQAPTTYTLSSSRPSITPAVNGQCKLMHLHVCASGVFWGVVVGLGIVFIVTIAILVLCIVKWKRDQHSEENFSPTTKGHVAPPPSYASTFGPLPVKSNAGSPNPDIAKVKETHCV